ncbi:ABC-type transport auxiliary lipoprotein family protein [Paraburkholderia susongensis]|uniref:Cholesterol transport system auxiliary component n=1 Tax=Paraburkholderia susongensis TaxID=1515439 RepID=A0A1X7JXV6_9BURK|nr:ABC-type transport auxiliary lipoprotein family protein [Paraburkholderia susongensis]SMG33024.1 cholesterol transport system auxiliary component [Paraburkholderia susongensis]
MSRSIHRLLSSRAALAALLAFGVLAAGCAGTSAVVSDIRYDLGPPPQAATAATLPAVKVLEVRAPAVLESDRLTYRLSYADAQQTAAYANSHWTMMPSQLLTQRLRGAFSAHGTVLTGADGVAAPVLRVDLTEFEQVFDSQADSHGAISALATLIHNGKVVGQHAFVASAPARSPDAAGGAQALAVASDDLVAQIVAWLGSQALAATQ